MTKKFKCLHDYKSINLNWDVWECQQVKVETERKRSEDLTVQIKEFAKCFVDTIREPFLLLDKDKKVIYVNKSFCDNFKVTVYETVGNLI